MSKLLSAYLWAWTNCEAGEKSVNSARKFYPDAGIFINVDYEGDIDTYRTISKNIGATLSVNKFQLGYCGNFGGRDYGRECWSRESTFEWMDKFYQACLLSDSKYMILLEEDDFVLKPISILSEEFSIAIHPTDPSPTGRRRPNGIPVEFLNYSLSNGGINYCPGYAAGGGTIINVDHFIKSWERINKKLWNDYDSLKKINKIIGWEDFILQFILMLGGYEVIQNHKLCEHWEVSNWQDFEIVTGLKDHKLIR